jgi:hypothetical protein
MEENDFSEDGQKDESQVLLEKTLNSSPKQRQLLKKQNEFELGEKKREVQDIEEGEKRTKMDIFLRWLILFLVAVGLIFLAKLLLY